MTRGRGAKRVTIDEKELARIVESQRAAVEPEKPRVRNCFQTKRVQTPVGTVSRTKQSFQEQCDINAIMRRWQSTGVLDHVNKQEARYGDFANAEEYMTAMARVREAQSQFYDLPAELRDRFNNDPAELIDWAYDPGNYDELVEAGLTELAEYVRGPVESPDAARAAERSSEAPAVEPPAKEEPEKGDSQPKST